MSRSNDIETSVMCKTIYCNILAYAETSRMKIHDIEQRAMLRRGYIKNINKYNRLPSVIYLLHIAQVLGITVDDLIGNETSYKARITRLVAEKEAIEKELSKLGWQSTENSNMP